jgi:four helix bundle protein
MSNELLIRTKKFCLDVLALVEKLPNTYLGNHIRGQMIRAGTSVAANYRAARLAQSRASFISKISIVIEEADESRFWCEIIDEKKLLKDPELYRVMKEPNEIVSILISSRKTMRKK